LASHQRGFTSINGCHANLVILNDDIKRAKSGGGGMVVAVDIAKAFDTVSHASILAALRDQGLHPFAVNLIGGIYASSTAMQRDGATLAIRRGRDRGPAAVPDKHTTQKNTPKQTTNTGSDLESH
jgi:hypothetical protein